MEGRSSYQRSSENLLTDMGIKLIRSSPYYAQANGQAEVSNQSLIKLIKRKVDEHPRRWHEVLSEALWAYRISCHGATKTSPYYLVYGQEVVLPWEITAGLRRIEFQNDLTAKEYVAMMNDNIEDLKELRLWSLEKIKENKAKVARAHTGQKTRARRPKPEKPEPEPIQPITRYPNMFLGLQLSKPELISGFSGLGSRYPNYLFSPYFFFLSISLPTERIMAHSPSIPLSQAPSSQAPAS
jgi:hypothetical protein